VPDIGCDACRRAIEGEVAGVVGVRLVQVDVTGRTVLVEGAAAEEAITAAIEAAGYEVAGSRAD
jgi:copper chaperone CopZ